MYRISGERLGVLIHTSSGMVRNGALSIDQREELERAGYRLESCAGVPIPQPNAEERAAIEENDKARAQLDRDIAKGLNQLLSPLRKRTHKEQFS